MSESDSSFKKRPPKKPDQKRSGGDLAAAADVLQRMLQNGKSQLSDGFVRWRLEREWSEVVGPTIAEQTLPVAYEKGRLYIWVRHSTWMQQLWYFQEAIKEKVNAHVGKEWTKDIKFTLSRRAAVGPTPEPAAEP